MLATIFFLISVFVITFGTWSLLIAGVNVIAHAIAKVSYNNNLFPLLVAYSIAVTYAVWYLMVL